MTQSIIANHPEDRSKRTWLIASVSAGVAGSLAGTIPFVASFAPSDRVKDIGSAVEVDISGLQPGDKMIIEWRGKPVWILRRTPMQLAALANHDDLLADPSSMHSSADQVPEYARNATRSIRPEYLVVVGICTHLGCSPSDRFTTGSQPFLPDHWPGGFYCACHGSTFDLAGRVFKDKPASDNLLVPPHRYLSDTRLLIGEDQKTS